MSENDTERLERVTNAAAELASELLDSGAVVVPRREVNRDVKERTEDERIDHGAIRDGFEAEGWTYSRHLYFHDERLRERAAEVAEELESATHLVAVEGEVLDRIVEPISWNGEEVDPIERGGETGWQRGKAVATVRETFEAEGWMVRELEGDSSSRTLYLLPLYDVIESLHPNGRPPFSADDIFRYYLSQSVEGTVGSD